MAFPIVEYRFDPEWRGGDAQPWTWHNKKSIDLRWVASASPYCEGVTHISLCAGDRSLIEVQYEDFMRDWVRAKGL